MTERHPHGGSTRTAASGDAAFAWIRPFSVATIAVWVLVCVTGAWSLVEVHPTAVATYQDMETLRSGFSWHLWMRRLHTASAVAAIVLAGFGAIKTVSSRATRSVGVLFVGLAVTCGAAAVLAWLIPWERIALWSIMSEIGLPGMPSVFANDSNFTLDNGEPWNPARYRGMRVLHQFSLPLVSAVFAVALGIFSSRRHRKG